MKRLRKEDLSLHFYLKNTVLRPFIETHTDIPLVYSSTLSDPGANSYVYETNLDVDPMPTSLGRGWVFTDSANSFNEQVNSVIVKDSLGAAISGTNYLIDYVDGRIITDNNTLDISTVDYAWHYVALVNEWSSVESSDVPVVVIEVSGFEKEGFQLGGGRRPSRRINIDIFAESTDSRDDISESLYDGLYNMSCLNQEFPKGTQINWDGTFSEDYEYATISGSSPLHFENVKYRTITQAFIATPMRDLTALSDLNRYRGRIICDMFHWEEA